MSIARWSPRARSEFDAYLTWIAERDADTALKIGEEIDGWIARLAAHPTTGAPSSRWPGCRKHSSPRRRKFILYRVSADHIEIVAFRDTRQDNSNLRLS
jgi:plasmid stabilization system protein ParE